MMPARPLKVAWFSYFPLEWLPDAPAEIQSLPRLHPAPWQRVLVEELSREPSVDLHVIALRKELRRDITFRWQGVSFHALKAPGGWRAPSLFWIDTWLIRRRLRSIQPDLVHAWGVEKGAAWVACRLRYPALITMQGLMNWIAERVPVNRYERFAALVERRALRRAKAVTAESRFAVEYLRHHHPHLRLWQIEHAPNPLFQSVQREVAKSIPRFLYVGAFTQLKGLDLLIQALEQLRGERDFQVTLVGGPQRGLLERLRQATSPALWQRIQIREGLSAGEVAAEMARATLLLFPTRVDTSPNAVKEAVVAGLPVVASAIGGIVDYVLPGRNGITFEAGNPAAFLGAIREALDHPLFGRGEVEAAALRAMRDYLSAGRMSAGFLQAYRQLLARE